MAPAPARSWRIESSPSEAGILCLIPLPPSPLHLLIQNSPWLRSSSSVAVLLVSRPPTLSSSAAPMCCFLISNREYHLVVTRGQQKLPVHLHLVLARTTSVGEAMQTYERCSCSGRDAWRTQSIRCPYSMQPTPTLMLTILPIPQLHGWQLHQSHVRYQRRWHASPTRVGDPRQRENLLRGYQAVGECDSSVPREMTY